MRRRHVPRNYLFEFQTHALISLVQIVHFDVSDARLPTICFREDFTLSSTAESNSPAEFSNGHAYNDGQESLMSQVGNSEYEMQRGERASNSVPHSSVTRPSIQNGALMNSVFTLDDNDKGSIISAGDQESTDDFDEKMQSRFRTGSDEIVNGKERGFNHALQAGPFRATIWTLSQMPLNISIVVRAEPDMNCSERSSSSLTDPFFFFSMPFVLIAHKK